MTGKRLDMTICPVCDGAVMRGDRHSPDDDLREIAERDAAYDSAFADFQVPLTRQASGRMQMAADRRMLLRLLRRKEAVA